MGESCRGEDEVVGGEGDPLDEVRRIGTLCAGRFQRSEEWRAVGEAPVGEPDKRTRRQELHPQAKDVAEGSVGIRDGMEEVRVFVVGAADADGSVAAEDFHLLDRLVHEPVPERGGFDADPGDRAADGDGLELRNHGRTQALRESRIGEILEGGHPFHLGDPAFRIDLDDPAEAPDVEPFGCGLPAGAEQVRRLLRQADRPSCPACHGTGEFPAGLAIGFPAIEKVGEVPVHQRTLFQPPRMPSFESTSCQSWVCRLRNAPAQERR